MSDRIRFYLDEHIDLDIARALRRRRIDVVTAQEAGQRATDDRVLLRTAFQQGRVFVTQDADALRLAAQGEAHAGIVFARHNTPIGVILRGLFLIYDATDAEGMRQQIEYL